jgi:uncharacterized membrane protein
MLVDYFIIACGLGGFAVSAYIYQTVQRKKTLTCPIGHTCDSVVHSKYGETFGFKNTLLGMLYYGAIVLIYGLALIGEIQFIPNEAYTMLVVTTGAFLFSAYLIYVQAFVLKEWCSWCVLSAMFTTGIFLGHIITIV